MKSIYEVEYLAVHPRDRQWGLAVTSVGFQNNEPNEEKPEGLHPAKYNFQKTTGRILDEYQLVYLTRGKGRLFCATLGKDNPVTVEEGDMIMLFPGEWHTYFPDDGYCWDEYWIGFQGPMADQWLEQGFVSKSKPIFPLGVRESLTELFRRAINLAAEQKPGFGQALSGIASDILGRAIFYKNNNEFVEDEVLNMVNQAKIIIADEVKTVTPNYLAEKLSVNYSVFRKTFKKYTGFAPGQYIAEIKVNKAKELLSGTRQSVKQIAYDLGFENQDYFVTLFKKRTGKRPSEFRQGTVL